MRINHNIAALNTYNKLTANTAATSKSLEKLSSGLKINKAGDNAAGLAISEKMRGQIRGLDQASTNASDAISLINTAEGALGETHSILQRMRELAVQSSNDTNVNIDRNEIQKEMNQLTNEINRIGNTTEFNTKKLLDGGGSQLTELNVDTTTMGGKAGGISTVSTKAASATGKATTSVTFAGTGGNLTLTFKSDDLGEDLNGYTFAIASGATSGVALVGKAVTITLAGGMSGATGATITNLLKTTGAVTQKITATVANATTGASVAGAIGSATALSMSAMTGGTASATRGVYEFDLSEAYVTADGADNNEFTVRLALSGAPGGFRDITLAANSGTTDGTNFNIGTAANRLTKEQQAANIASALNQNGNVNGNYTASAIGSKITLTEKVGSESGTAVSRTATAGTAEAGVMTYTQQSQDIVEAGGKFTIDGTDIIVVASGAGTGLDTGTFIELAANETASGQMTKLAAAITANTTLNTKYTAVSAANSPILTLTQANGSETRDEAVMTMSDKTGSGFQANFQIGANTAQSLTVEVNDMRSAALGVAGTKEGGDAVAKNGSIAKFTSTKDITDGTTNTGVEYALDVSTHEKATAAISVINDAIESVSAERSKLGSYQNRLEHTINNLGTSSENLTTAESRIRDVDMAKEMMEFTKNNILSQAAQSMLAQANQQPQGVLQLLQ
ncbi:flagellin [Acetobacterium malicum]|uniref:flagellin N-terminal helical domain-containing protein n=1 Tax=Acetobacterium malicum TaxID=52692 RepID=UPI0003FAE793|nr:flagellin [Acetobacterium dehalogenans]